MNTHHWEVGGVFNYQQQVNSMEDSAKETTLQLPTLQEFDTWKESTSLAGFMLAEVTHPRMETRSDPLPKRRIEKVPLILRRDTRNEGYYDPKMVSMGPYHHGKEELQMGENLKPKVAQLFVLGSDKAMDEFYHKVREKVDDARSCYVEGSTDKYSDEEFAGMMLLDGCLFAALIEFSTPGDHQDRRLLSELQHLGLHTIYSLSYDIFGLLENQLPFLVIELLMSLKFGVDKGREMLDMYCITGTTFEIRPKEVKASEIYKKQPLHFLEYHWLWENEVDQPNESESTDGILAKHNWKEFFYSFRSIGELKAKGIHARLSSNPYTRAIKFKSYFFFGLLELPQLYLTAEEITCLANIVAYEWTSNNPPRKLSMMGYLNFMKSLINHPDDVKELRLKNILFSTFGNDQEVVEKFNSIVTFGVEDISRYDEVKERIQKHYNSKAKTWMAELVHNYFSSPWMFIAFLAATSLLALSFLQTYFTIFPRSGK